MTEQNRRPTPAGLRSPGMTDRTPGIAAALDALSAALDEAGVSVDINIAPATVGDYAVMITILEHAGTLAWPFDGRTFCLGNTDFRLGKAPQ